MRKHADAFRIAVARAFRAGRAETLKESVIASALYSVESGSDSVVRVDARRLRDKLREFYTDHPAETVLITLPKGSYVPRFEWAMAEALAAQQPVPPKQLRRSTIATAVA